MQNFAYIFKSEVYIFEVQNDNLKISLKETKDNVKLDDWSK